MIYFEIKKQTINQLNYLYRISYISFVIMMKQVPKQEIKNDKEYFANIKQSERSAWIQKMLQTEQKTGEYPLYKMEYPNTGKWTFKEIEYHYNYKLSQIQPARAMLFYFAGLNSHSGTSAYTTINAAKGYPIDIYGLDFKNFGRSGGEQRGFIESEESLLEQAEQFVSFIVSQQKDKKKIFLSGLSLGGAVCFKLAIRHPQRYSGIILLSPALRENKQCQPYMKKIGKFIGSWFPTLKLTNQTFTFMSKVNQTDRFMKDPYIYKDRVVPGSVKVVLDMMEQIQKQYSKLTVPFIIIQSGVDKMVDPFLALDLQKQSKSQDKTVVYFKDMWHAVIIQDELPQVIEILNSWLGSRVGK